MKKKTIGISLLVLVTVALLAAGTWHCLGWMLKNEMSHGQLTASRTWPKRLHLRADQQAALIPLEKKLMNDLAPIEIELASQQMVLCRLTMSAEAVDRKAISQRLIQVGELQKRKEERMIDHLIAIRGILAPNPHLSVKLSSMRIPPIPNCPMA
jgi:Spy/CpxP family protein refolding chaperone